MDQNQEINTYFQLAANYVNTTNQHLYLTGKAGSGKTTFLRYIKENCHKKLAVAAPTGVAAMNAEGVTLHSLFQLPLGGFYPGEGLTDSDYGDFFDKKNLLKNLRLNSAKRQLLQEIELLIIDEVSMLRADMLDAIDVVLKSVRRNSTHSFGGVQVLFIGDLFQLPPVVKNQEWNTLSKFYSSPSFFNAKALQNDPPVYLELKNIYRQSDKDFIEILNKIRNNAMKADDLELLNKYYQPDFKPKKPGEYITLTTHNRKADIINNEQLKLLSGEVHRFTASVTGDFNENTVIAEMELELKEGAQVMFIRNDKGENPRYYNGKIGIIKGIKGEDITVAFPESGEELTIERDIWENKRYKLNKETDILEEDVKGTFTQYPIRLAWAITIHKSQGLTFEKAIIDAGDSFAAGQVYVALSRLTSLDGLVLYSKIANNNISSDQTAIDFSNQEKKEADLNTDLVMSQKSFISDLLISAYDLRKLKWSAGNFLQELHGKRIPDKDSAINMFSKFQESISKQFKTSEIFVSQLKGLLSEVKDKNYAQVHERVDAAAQYFNKNLLDQLQPLNEHFESLKLKSGVKKYKKGVHEVICVVKQKAFQLEEMGKLTQGLVDGQELPEILSEMRKRMKEEQSEAEKIADETSKKKVKGESQRLSLEMYKEGKSIEKIAEERSLAASTIEGHLMSFIGTEFELSEFVSEDKVANINKVIDSLDEVSSGIVKSKLGDEYSYAQIRAVMNDRAQKKKQE